MLEINHLYGSMLFIMRFLHKFFIEILENPMGERRKHAKEFVNTLYKIEDHGSVIKNYKKRFLLMKQ